MRRQTMTFLAAALVAAIVPAAPGGAAGDRSFPAGSWSGDVVFVAVHVPTGATAAGGGDFELDSDGVAVAGSIGWSAVTSSGSAAVEASLDGPASAPRIVDGIVTTSAGAFPMDRPLDMPITWATCELVAGSGVGVNSVDVSADWIAHRSAATADAASFDAEVERLVVDLHRIEAAVASGEAFETGALIDVAARAVELAASLDRSPDCADAAGAHAGVAAHIVARILGLALEHPDGLTDGALADLAVAALEVGAIGSGSSDPGAADLEFALIEELGRRIDEATASGDLGRLFDLGALAQQLGYESLEQRAIDGLGGG